MPTTSRLNVRSGTFQRVRAKVPVPRPFSLFATVISHGWYQTRPFFWDERAQMLSRAERLADGRVMLVRIRQEPGGPRGFCDVAIDIIGPNARAEGVAEEIVRRCIVMLHLDEDLSGFYDVCRNLPELTAARRFGAGRCMRGSSLFEDVVKTILGTNVLWKQAVVMINRVAELGDECGTNPRMRAWPTPGQIVRAGERYLRGYVRAGYRAPYILELAQKQKSGEIDLEAIEANARTQSADDLFRTLSSLKGVGKSSAHFLMTLLGHYDHISIDSATYAYARRELFDGRTPSERQIRARFARYGRWQSLVYWFARWRPQVAWWEDAAGRATA